MFYTVYKITDTINGKYYIGKHQTKNLDDGYMGSGKLIRHAINKHGRENFKKEILFIFDTEEQMNAKEAEIVVVSEETYNLCDGGKGGFSHINKILSKEDRKKISQLGGLAPRKAKPRLSKIQRNVKNKFFGGKTHSIETKKQMSLSHIGKHDGNKNSQYGTMWITNGIENKKIKKDHDLPLGFYKGRI